MWRAGKVIAIIHVEDWMEPLKTRREGRTDTQSHHSFSSCQELDSKFVEWRPESTKHQTRKMGRWRQLMFSKARQGSCCQNFMDGLQTHFDVFRFRNLDKLMPSAIQGDKQRSPACSHRFMLSALRSDTLLPTLTTARCHTTKYSVARKLSAAGINSPNQCQQMEQLM